MVSSILEMSEYPILNSTFSNIFLEITKVVVKTSSVNHAGTNDLVVLKICSKSSPTKCCSFKPDWAGADFDQNQLNEYTGNDLRECKGFDPEQIGQVRITSTGYDGWRGSFIDIHQSGEITSCPIKAWLDDKKSIALQCTTERMFTYPHLDFKSTTINKSGSSKGVQNE